ncbi:sperm-associated antigen 6 armadillo repeat-containing [Holotrichia oblita]|uniref:Sperm-associated antigen 6 armadillo repeat-containing n=1 Tax=Holotrichia oblita TaxID=644536 RepID=A0ACB9SHR8_HOLOL|nr:sperm-associated antigen 6 armadillo repeat-containing [Holotrichia oblita]
MTARSILQVFDRYQKERVAFVQNIAELAIRPQNVDILNQAHVLALLRPLLSDICVQIQQCAIIALGRLVNHDVKVAQEILNQDFIPLLIRNIDKKNKYYKKAVLFVLRSVCKHDAEMANVVVTCSGALEALIICLEDFEPIVKENAAWALGYIARHSPHLAQSVVDTGALPLLVLCLQEPELALRQIGASAMSDIAKHSVELAQSVVDAGAVPHLAKSLNNPDEKLKRQILAALSSIAKHTTELAEVVVEAEIFPSVLIHMAHGCPIVRKNAAALVRDVVKHSLELTQLVVNTGGIGAIVESIGQPTEESKVPCITACGFIAGHSDLIAMSVIGCEGILQLRQILDTCKDDATLSVTAWALGQIGKHSPEHSKAVAAAGVFPILLKFYTAINTSEDLKYKSKITLKQCLQKCMMMSALEPLIHDCPKNILKYILGQFSKVLPNDAKARRLFVTSGALGHIQELDAEPGSTLMEYITIINSCFPEEIVRYVTPGYPDSLLEKVEQYSPQMMTILRETEVKSSDMQTDDVLQQNTSTSPTTSHEIKTLIETQ